MKIIRAAFTVGSYTFLSRLAGMLREILVSHVLGAGPVTDAFVVAFKLPNFFRRFFAEGAFNAAFVPMFAARLQAKGPKDAERLATQVFWAMALFLFLFVLLVEFTTPYAIHVIAPGFSATPYRFDLAVEYSRVTFPYILLISLAALMAGILNSFDKFAAAAAAPILLNFTAIAALLGYSYVGMEPAYLLSWAVTAAGVLQFLWMYLGCRKIGINIKYKRPRLTPDVKKVIRLMTPGAIGAGVMQVNILVDMILASLLPTKALSYLYFADRLNQLPLSLFGIAIGIALLPLLSKQLKAKEYDKARNSQNISVEIAMQLTIPAAVGLAVLCYPIIDLIYGHGVFSSEDVGMTAPALAAYALGLPAYVLSKVLSSTYFAYHDTTTPVKVAGVSVACNIVLNLILMWPLKHVGMALATSIAAWINASIMYVLLNRSGKFILSHHVKKIIIRVTIAASCMGVIVFMIDKLIIDTLNQFSDFVANIIEVGFLMFLGMASYTLIGQLIGALSINKLKKNLMKGKTR